MNDFCRHHDCQSFHAEALSGMAEKLRRPELLAEAIAIHKANKEVRCQRAVEGRASRSGAPNAPLPERKEVP